MKFESSQRSHILVSGHPCESGNVKKDVIFLPGNLQRLPVFLRL